MKTEKTGAVIVAAGMSRRMDGKDKLFQTIGGKSLLGRLIDCFEACNLIDEIVIVVNEVNQKPCQKLVEIHGWPKISQVCIGGLRRQDSVKIGLQTLTKCQWVVIHDGARPLLNVEIIENGIKEAKKHGAAIAAVPVKNTIKIASPEGFVQSTPRREGLWTAQTPQIFDFDLIQQAHEQISEDVSDDAIMVEKTGHQVKLYMGSYQNIKITTPEDLALATLLIESR